MNGIITLAVGTFFSYWIYSHHCEINDNDRAELNNLINKIVEEHEEREV